MKAILLKPFDKSKRKIIKPLFGWKPNTWYLVDVAYNEHNVIHRDLFFTGFLNGKSSGFLPWKRKTPGGYNSITCFGPYYNFITCQGSAKEITNVFYLKPIKLVVNEQDLKIKPHTPYMEENYESNIY